MPLHLVLFYSACVCDVLLLWVLARGRWHRGDTMFIAVVLFALTVGLFHAALKLMCV